MKNLKQKIYLVEMETHSWEFAKHFLIAHVGGLETRSVAQFLWFKKKKNNK